MSFFRDLFIEILIMMIEFHIQDLLYKFQALVSEHWYDLEPTFNPGQLTIYYNYMWSNISDFLEMAGDVWPWVDTVEYEFMLYECFDEEVMYRAFSGAIENPILRMDEIIYEAQENEMRKEILQGLMGF